jgi:predicted RNA binding protein YcfA (HicA-like mRNA interferase family)
MSVKRRDLVQYLEENGFRLLREGANHSIYTNGPKIIPFKRHRQLDRITANEICKQAGLTPIAEHPDAGVVEWAGRGCALPLVTKNVCLRKFQHTVGFTVDKD